MSWFHEPEREVVTKRNGVMRLRRFFGEWILVAPDSAFSASGYMDGVWKRVVRWCRWYRLDVRRCLVLGVAMGGTFGIVQRAWPDADIVGVDWEPSLLDLGRELGIYRPDARVEFVEGDAIDVVPKLEGTFDLVVVDLFDGRRVADAVLRPELRAAVKSRLSDRGVVAVNVYKGTDDLAGWAADFGTPKVIRYYDNRMGLFGPGIERKGLFW